MASVGFGFVAAALNTAFSADTSWRFAEHHLGMNSTTERSILFAAGEVSLVACAGLARRNLHSEKRAPGVPGVLVWLITGVQIIPAYSESGLLGGTVRAVFGPVLAALLWHEAMGVELRGRMADAKSRSLPARIMREIGQRVLSRLGLAERDRDAEQIGRDRAMTEAVTLAAQLAAPIDRGGSWLSRRRLRRLSTAIDRAQVGTDARQREQLLERLAARRHAAELLTTELKSPWSQAGQGEPRLDQPFDSHKHTSGAVPAGDSTSGTGPLSHNRSHPASGYAPDELPVLEEHGSAPSPTGLKPSEAVPEHAAPTPKRTGRPPDMTLDEVLAVGRTILERTGAGSVPHRTYRAEIAKLERKTANELIAQARDILAQERATTRDSDEGIE
ncbi:hypothetical protein [Streptomyces sp. NBC_01304]|uniref:hypothetical protein n=1 Tax=Streptomyces sp. NBC_01304 TaxID=2903818 RepID=UPI002E13A99C|nr:hypothetical protein OG430_23195 [Streptomyces sp. NBC_01304]